MTQFVVTAGFNSQKILRPIFNYGINAGDSINILVPDEESPPAPREQAIEDVKETLHAVNGEDITIRLTEIDCSHVITGIFACREQLHESKDSQPVVCVGGGVTDLLISLVIATITCWPENIESVRYYSELQSTGRDCTLPNLLTRLPGRAANTYDTILNQTGYELRAVNSESLSSTVDPALPMLGGQLDRTPPSSLHTTDIDQVAEATEKSPATVNRHITALVDADLVVTYIGGSRHRFCPTVSGLLRV